MTVAIVIIGGGGHAKVVASMLRERSGCEILGYIDLEDRGLIEGLRYLGSDADLTSTSREGDAPDLVLGIGHLGPTGARRGIAARLEQAGFRFAPVISTHATVAASAVVERGTVVMPRAVINACGRAGAFSIVNTGAIVEHDTILGEHTHVAPGAVVCGGVTVGTDCFIGAGAVIAQGLAIANATTIGAGCVVTRSLQESGVYVGCPARRIR
jgi:sugar O-acyltransferase (sialic acid O-acetyltransferase NeuD family)